MNDLNESDTIGSVTWLSNMTDRYGDMLIMEGYNDCIEGVCIQFGKPPCIIYNREKVINTLVSQGMTIEEAEDFHEFNQAGAYMGENTPVFMLT